MAHPNPFTPPNNSTHSIHSKTSVNCMSFACVRFALLAPVHTFHLSILRCSNICLNPRSLTIPHTNKYTDSAVLCQFMIILATTSCVGFHVSQCIPNRKYDLHLYSVYYTAISASEIHRHERTSASTVTRTIARYVSPDILFHFYFIWMPFVEIL